MQPAVAIACLSAALIGACSPSGERSANRIVEADTSEDLSWLDQRVPDPQFDARGNRIYTATELSYRPVSAYPSIPRDIAQLLQHHDVEQDWCRGASGTFPETLRACNRAGALFYRIRKLGYCWGSDQDESPSETEKRWLKCSDDLSFDPAQPVLPDAGFSVSEIAEAEQNTKELLARREAIAREQQGK